MDADEFSVGITKNKKNGRNLTHISLCFCASWYRMNPKKLETYESQYRGSTGQYALAIVRYVFHYTFESLATVLRQCYAFAGEV